METALSDLAAAQGYFERFARAFITFDGNQVADLFVTPGIALRRDGSIVALTTREDVVRYYQAALDHYHRGGCRTARWSRLETAPMSRRSLVAAVSWELLRDDGITVIQWRQSYVTRNFDENDPSAFASAMHVE